MSIPDRSTFESAYAGQAPWDIGRPQKALSDVADQITGSILDAGCGTGDNALFFAFTLPISFVAVAAVSFSDAVAGGEVAEAAESAPDSANAGFAVAFAGEEAAQL